MTTALNRLINVVSDPDTGEQVPVYLQPRPPVCGPPDADLMRLIDVVSDPYTGEQVPVYGAVSRCHKDWKGPEEYVNYDTSDGHGAVPGGPVIRLSAELELRWESMEDCTLDGSGCPTATLTYDEATNAWLGEFAFNDGTATFEFYGFWDGFDVNWRMRYGGCVTDPTPLGFTPLCSPPATWTGAGGSAVFTTCCTAEPQPSIMKVHAKITPMHLARLVGVVPDPVTGKSIPVFAAAEDCGDCPFTPGCCSGVPIGADLEYTVFGITQTLGTCDRSCSGVTEITPTGADGCYAWEVTTCGGPHEICLVCDTGASSEAGERGWEHYRLDQGGVLYEPASGSCDPFSVTFHNIPWLSPWPTGECGGTYSVTVTLL